MWCAHGQSNTLAGPWLRLSGKLGKRRTVRKPKPPQTNQETQVNIGDDVTKHSKYKPPQYPTRLGQTVKKYKKLVEEDSPNGQSFKRGGSCKTSRAQDDDWENSHGILRKSVE